MEYILFDDFKDVDIYQDFIHKNPLLGTFRVQVSAFSNALPMSDVDIEIYKDIGEYNVLFFKGKTNDNGVIDDIFLPAPSRVNVGSFDIPEYSVYMMNVYKDGYLPLEKYTFSVFGNLKSLQNVVLKPIVDIEKK